MSFHTLRCRVVDVHDRPLPDVSVTITDAPIPLPDLAQLTDEAGAFDWGALPAGKYTLRLVGAKHSKEVTTALPLAEPLVVTLP